MRAAQPPGGAARTLSGPMSEHLDLADWRRRVTAMYDGLRHDNRAEPARLLGFRAAKDRLFVSHPASPVPRADRRDFRGLAYWRHAPALALRAPLEPDPAAPPLDLPRSGAGPHEYAGGLFIPFRDATSGKETYGGGRYLWDSGKGADLGSDGDELAIDFNYAYHPSCVYDPVWSCPLAPPENWLTVPIQAGERLAPAS